MDRMKTRQTLATHKMEVKAMSVVDAFNPDEETRAYAQRLFKRRCEGWGDETNALEDCGTWTQMSARSFKRLISGETKKAGAFFAQVRKGYLDYCARKAAELQNEIQLEKARFGNVRIGDLDKDVEALVAKIEAARAVKIEP